MIYPLVKLPSYYFSCNWQYLLVTLVIQWVKLKIPGKWLVLSGLSTKQLLFPSVILIKIQLKKFTASNLTQMFSSLWWSWKISCYIYLHYEIVLLMIWVQYRSKFESQTIPAQYLGKSFLTFRTSTQKLYFELLW